MKKGLIALMVGRPLQNLYPKTPREAKEVLWEVNDWTLFDQSTNKRIENISFQVRRGEVLGLAGLVGCGRTELVMSFYGLWGKYIKGTMALQGKPITVKNASSTIKAGISLASEDRKRYGLVLEQHIQSNVSLASLEQISTYSIVDEAKEIVSANQYSKDLRIKSSSILQKTIQLSGGNQQKVVLAKWLMTKPKILILDEPTRGIDVGAKIEIYHIINSLVEQGVGIIVISSELNELLGVCDRIVVMSQGKITGEMPAAEATQEKIMSFAVAG
jgi:ABC-type sugar transport system ATPase subunit